MVYRPFLRNQNHFSDIISINAFEKDTSSQPLIRSKSKFYLQKNTNKVLDQHIDSLHIAY